MKPDTPMNNPPNPAPSGAKRITPELDIKFPCYLWHIENANWKYHAMAWSDAWLKDLSLYYSHYAPDGPCPTEIPDSPPAPAATQGQTPRTDAVKFHSATAVNAGDTGMVVEADFARTLERELAATQRQLLRAEKKWDELLERCDIQTARLAQLEVPPARTELAGEVPQWAKDAASSAASCIGRITIASPDQAFPSYEAFWNELRSRVLLFIAHYAPPGGAGEGDSKRLLWLKDARLSAEEYADLIECFKWAGKTFTDIRSAIDAAMGGST